MTNPHPPLFGLQVDHDPDGAVVRVEGDLDYETHRELVDAVTPLLTTGGSARDRSAHLVRLNFAGLRCVDSSGLSALLLLRRRADEAGVRLVLEERPLALERVLVMTGTLGHLTAPEQASGGQGRPGTG
ncbi:STAS domain-containing protein [Streptomyces sp. NPDC101209]|uniref:STAS domain-containing protein n=1 Tax=Streptomyces sp. NPDC101209 TaxID=3366129 RepID=UPI0038231A19